MADDYKINVDFYAGAAIWCENLFCFWASDTL